MVAAVFDPDGNAFDAERNRRHRCALLL
jgi:hypothetical protein